MTSRCTHLISLIVSHLVEKCFSGRSSAGSPAGSGRTTPATWSTPRRGACSVPRDHPTPAPDSPARRRAAEVKMVGYITVAHGGAQRLSEKWRHFVVHCLYSLFCTSPRCVGVLRGAGLSRPRHAQCTSRNSALTSHVARVVAMDPCPRCVVWGRGVVLFFCAALNKRPSLCGVSWWSAGFAQGGASANLVW